MWKLELGLPRQRGPPLAKEIEMAEKPTTPNPPDPDQRDYMRVALKVAKALLAAIIAKIIEDLIVD